MGHTDALQSAEARKKKAAFLSLLAALFLTTIKLGVGLYTNSLAILSEALHSGLILWLRGWRRPWCTWLPG